MPRFKDHNYDQTKMIPISFDRQILPGTLEYSLIYLVEHELDLSLFDHRYRNDEAGRPAYDPAILLEDCFTGLFPRHHQQPQDRTVVSGEYPVYGHLGG